MKRNSITTDLEFHVERNEEEIVLYVLAHVTLGYPAKTSGPPEDCYPSECDEVDFELFENEENTIPWKGELTEEEEDELVDYILDDIEFAPFADHEDYIDEEDR